MLSKLGKLMKALAGNEGSLLYSIFLQENKYIIH